MNHCMPLMTETMIVNESPKREHKGGGEEMGSETEPRRKCTFAKQEEREEL